MIAYALLSLVLLLSAVANAQTTTALSTSGPAVPSITAIFNCHAHTTKQYCEFGATEYEISGPTKTEEMEARYTSCHPHGTKTYCFSSKDQEVEVIIPAEDNSEEQEHSHKQHEEEEHAESGGRNCHFHAGVEHCTGGAEATCKRTDREYNVPLRIGLLFVILATSVIGVFAPTLAASFTKMSQQSVVFVALKQFGTGIVISTAFIHLYTHAELTFKNECLGALTYEGKTAAIFMAGLFLSFLVEYLGARFIIWRQSRSKIQGNGQEASREESSRNCKTALETAVIGVHGHGKASDKIGVVVLEGGIVLHSLLIGLTLVLAGDSSFKVLLVVILFHQMFEGIALGTCIAGLPSRVALLKKLLMASIFALITPVGMAIGMGVLNDFNGSDKPTLVALGTLNALSAGILAWVGLVEMLASDWMHGPLMNAAMGRTTVAIVALVSGLVVMSVLGKWA
ncbi:ZIP zinc transporter-domain-containing protein [Clohesyomyces aquaticus]|uniref:ZIP zinc transporter-domain-containing protein n=1 Tax=Clohesyomyces aquaticus TaxID=1231657 RepID=A0A1Y2A6Y4_9PLEO|nr:ZIP zinc transporter-domain-containing protein [Clohesyomyces aquaticus]